MKTTLSVGIVFICALWSSFSYSQDVCDEALIHIADCQTVFCAVNGSDGCPSAFDGLQAELASCSNELASEVLNSTCARLAGEQAGNVCERASQRYMTCLDQTCLTNPDSPFCAAEVFDAVREAYAEIAGVECHGEFEAEAEATFQMSCEELFPIY